MWVLGKVRGNGRAGCPISQVPFPLLVLWDAALATSALFPEAIPLTEAMPLWPHWNSHGNIPWEESCLKVVEACPQVALVCHQTCSVSPADRVEEVKEIPQLPISSQHYHCFLTSYPLALTYHPNSTTFNHNQGANN